MLKKLLVVATFSLCASMANASFPTEQVWEATHTNTQQVCGIDYSNSKGTGQILTKGEQGTDTAKAIQFDLKANTRTLSWKITEAKIVDNAGRFDFSDNLMTITDRTQTSLFVNNTEYDWSQSAQAHVVDPRSKLKLAPKINLDATEFPLGTTKIQGKIVVTCSN